MASVQPTPIPEVYVLWHPRCPLGEFLAQSVLQWLQPGNGLGPKVFYRCLPAPEAPTNGLPLPLPGEGRYTSGATTTARSSKSNLQIVLPLIDENMVADPSWRIWLNELASSATSSRRRAVLPVALDSTAYNMPVAVRELNYLRPAGLPLTTAEGEATASARKNVARSLLKQLTEAMCRLLLPRPPSQEQPEAIHGALPKVSIFLSHAKRDGTVPASRLRDYIHSRTQLAAFYDENDIAFGGVFNKIIKSGLNSADTAAMIVIRSKLYAARPWCRRELSLFRKPRHDRSIAGEAEHWRLYPTVVVEAMEGGQISTGLAELGNSSLIRWSDGESDLEELIVTTVIRDALLAAFHSALGATIPEEPNQIVINWLPDPTTLLHIGSVQSQTECDVLYPGRGLSGLELDILSEYFPKLTFRSFDEALA